MKSQRFSRSLCALLVALMLSCDGKEEAKITPDPNPNASDLPFTKGGEKPPAPAEVKDPPAVENISYQNGKITWSKPKGFEKIEFVYYVHFFAADDTELDVDHSLESKFSDKESLDYKLPADQKAMIVRIVASAAQKKASPPSKPYTIKAPVVGALPEEKKVLNPITNPVAKDKPVEVVEEVTVVPAVVTEEQSNTKEVIGGVIPASEKSKAPLEKKPTEAPVVASTKAAATDTAQKKQDWWAAGLAPKPVSTFHYEGNVKKVPPGTVDRAPKPTIHFNIPFVVSWGSALAGTGYIIEGGKSGASVDVKNPTGSTESLIFNTTDKVTVEVEGGKEKTHVYNFSTSNKLLAKTFPNIVPKDGFKNVSILVEGPLSQKITNEIEGVRVPHFAMIMMNENGVKTKLIKLPKTSTQTVSVVVWWSKMNEAPTTCIWKLAKEIEIKFSYPTTYLNLSAEVVANLKSAYAASNSKKEAGYVMSTQSLLCSLKQKVPASDEGHVNITANVSVSVDTGLLPKIQVVP